MEVRIKNRLITPIVKFLYELKLKGKQSRHRSRFIKKLEDKLQDIQVEEHEIRKQHCNLDENGEPKTTKMPDGQDIWDIADLQGFVRDRNEMMDEEYVIDDTDSQIMLETLKLILDEFDDEISGDDADVYDYLCEQFGVE